MEATGDAAAAAKNDDTVVIAFLNSKSGGQMGPKVLNSLKKMLPADRLFDLKEVGEKKWAPEDKLRLYAECPNLRVLVCGGDGTMGWLFSCIDRVQAPPGQFPVAMMPLGTGNDLSRSFKWGPGFSGDMLQPKFLERVRTAVPVELDRWLLCVMPYKPLLDTKKIKATHLPPTFTIHQYTIMGGGGDTRSVERVGKTYSAQMSREAHAIALEAAKSEAGVGPPSEMRAMSTFEPAATDDVPILTSTAAAAPVSAAAAAAAAPATANAAAAAAEAQGEPESVVLEEPVVEAVKPVARDGGEVAAMAAMEEPEVPGPAVESAAAAAAMTEESEIENGGTSSAAAASDDVAPENKSSDALKEPVVPLASKGSWLAYLGIGAKPQAEPAEEEGKNRAADGNNGSDAPALRLDDIVPEGGAAAAAEGSAAAAESGKEPIVAAGRADASTVSEAEASTVSAAEPSTAGAAEASTAGAAAALTSSTKEEEVAEEKGSEEGALPVVKVTDLRTALLHPQPSARTIREFTKWESYDGVFCNYFSVGVDAVAAAAFHEHREAHPELFTSRTRNQLWYVRKGLPAAGGFPCCSAPPPQRLHQYMTVSCRGLAGAGEDEWVDVELPRSARGLIILNLQSYGGGHDLWGASGPASACRSAEGALAPTFNDGRLEIVAVSSIYSMGRIMALNKAGVIATRVCQCKEIRIRVRETMHMQIDGEPWKQADALVHIKHVARSTCLVPLKHAKAAPSPATN